MTSCPAEADLLLLVDGDLDEADAVPLVDHLQECAACRAALAHAEAALCYALGGLADQERVVETATVLPLRRRVLRVALTTIGVAAALLVAATVASRPHVGKPAPSDARPADVASRDTRDTTAPVVPETLEERLDRLLLEARELSATPADDAVAVEELAAFAAARVRVDVLGPAAGQAAFGDVIARFPGTDAARRARAELTKLGDDR